MRYTLKNYQFTAAHDVSRALRRATRDVEADASDYWAVTLSAPTGAGKTVIASAVIEALFDGDERTAADPRATVLWVTDDPALNAQTRRNMAQASSGLGPGRLITIDSAFDQAEFDPGRVYFLNIQKLAKSNPLSRGNTENRLHSLWETIDNTIASNGARFYVVIDEAHRGMKSESDRQTIVSRIINGQAGINAPAPIVWGISATPERFDQALVRWGDHRTKKSVNVPIEEVRASGLLKDMIVLDNPKAGQIGGDTTFVRAAVTQTLAFEESWRTYGESENEPLVLPALVIQVQNKPSDAEYLEILSAVFDTWDGLRDRNVVNTFGEHTTLNVGGYAIPYMAPQDIHDDTDVRVVLCKDAISTGWDCPRAEVLVSLRTAQDYTYIAQLIGRMVRTPLARRIQTDQTLNDVHCYLPRFNKEQVDAIVRRFREGSNDEPPVEIIDNPVTLEHNDAVPSKVYELLAALPTYVVPGRIYRTQIARLHTLATLLAGDHIVEDALSQTRVHLIGVLQAQRARLESDGTFQRDLNRIKSLRVERSYALLAAESLDDLPAAVGYEIDRDDKNVEDLFKVARRKLPEGVAVNYWNDVIDAQGADDYDPTEAKAETAVLALHPEVVDALEAAAEQLVSTWLRVHQRSISKLSDAKKAQYEPVKQETRAPELTELIVPRSKTVPGLDQRWPKHVLADDEGTYPSKHRGWESQVLEAELADADLVAWYRNPTGGSGALRLPYRGHGAMEKSMYPDFVMFHNDDAGIRPSIIDPHGYHLTDAAAKLRGLARYAERHGNFFGRIDSVAEVDGKLMALDLLSTTVRTAIESVDEDGVLDLFKRLAGNYR